MLRFQHISSSDLCHFVLYRKYLLLFFSFFDPWHRFHHMWKENSVGCFYCDNWTLILGSVWKWCVNKFNSGTKSEPNSSGQRDLFEHCPGHAVYVCAVSNRSFTPQASCGCTVTCLCWLTFWSVLGNDGDHLSSSFQRCCCLFMCGSS